MAKTIRPWHLRPKRVVVTGLPKATVIPTTKAYELLLAVCESSSETHRILSVIKTDGLAIELPDHRSLIARADGSFLLVEKSDG